MRFTARALLAALLVASCAVPSPAPSSPSTASTAPPATTQASPLTSAPPAAKQADDADDAAIAAASKDYVELRSAISPEGATLMGLHDRDAELDDRTIAGFEAATAREEQMLGTFRERFKVPRASRIARTDLAIIEHWLAVDIRERRELRRLERRPQEYLEPLNALFLMIAREYAPAPERAKNVLARVEKLPSVIAAAKANLKNPPKVWTETAIEESKHAALFFEDARKFLDGALDAEKPRVAKALTAAKAAYTEYALFLQKDVLPRSIGEFAIGRPLFDFLLHEDYFLDEDADGVLALGKHVFDVTLAQMDEVAKRIDPKAKGWPDVTKRLKANHPTPIDLIASYKREVDRARAFLVEKDAVTFPAGEHCEVIPTPPFQRATITAAYEGPPPFDTKMVSGLFFVTPIDMSLSKVKQEEMLRENDHGDQVDTVVHEAYPGHHLQLSFARSHPSLARKATGPSIFSEGWALYAEEVMSELGYYTDEERLFQLEWTLVRAARVMIDVGLQTQGMTFDEAMRILTERVHLEHELALSEVKRYTADPTQPLAYLVGREILFKIRAKYKEREGQKYALKSFHTEVLSHGTIAPGLLAKEIFEP